MPLVTSGVEKGNLRELALARMGQLGTRCRDVRTREAGIQDIHHQVRRHPDADAQCLRQLTIQCILSTDGMQAESSVSASLALGT